MAQAEFNDIVDVDLQKLFSVITDYEKYPEFVTGCSQAKVMSRQGTKARVQYSLNLFKEVTYTLDHESDEATGQVRWNLVESDFLKKNTGSWQLKQVGPGRTDVTYALEVEFKIPVPGLILNRLVKSSLPTAVRDFEKRAKST